MVELELSDFTSLADRIFKLLEEAILSGRMPLGARLVENELAEKLSVSRSPLREAIRRLEFEGLVRTVPRRGSYVIEPSAREIVDLLQVREYLEGLAARLAAKLMSPEQLDALAKDLEQVRSTLLYSSAEGYPQRNLDFHHVIVMASGNERLIEMVGSLHRQSRLIRYRSGAQPERAMQALEEHFLVLEALRARDPDQAEARMRLHIRESMANTLRALAKQEGDRLGTKPE